MSAAYDAARIAVMDAGTQLRKAQAELDDARKDEIAATAALNAANSEYAA